jgi:arginyl-tRNA synthetase
MLTTQNRIRQALLSIVSELTELTAEEIPFAIPTQRTYGELSTTLPFVLAKKLGQKPYALGMMLKEKMIGRLPEVRDMQLVNGGFLNFFFCDGYWLAQLQREQRQKTPWMSDKVIVEHTSINPNKAAHIGHLRNSCLGDTLARAYRYLGAEVEVQNYIDDTGIQVADVVWGLMQVDGKNLEAIRRITDLPRFLWEAYPRYSRLLGEDETKSQARNRVHRVIEERHEPEYSVSLYVAETVLHDHLKVMGRLGIDYHLLVREQDIMAMNFFSRTADILRENGILYPSKDPEKAGCEVIYYEAEKLEKIVIRSNGTVTYIGKDLAYTFWKLGLSGRDFLYRPFCKGLSGQDVWISEDRNGEARAGFGHGNRVFNVIDVRQSYLQAIIGQVVGTLYHGEKDRFAHFSYEMVALTPACVEELGFTLSEEDKAKAYVEVSGRKGIAVEANDLIDRLQARSFRELAQRNPEIEAGDLHKIACDIAVGALRYFMLRYASNTVIAFDFDEALAFEGDTGPYLQYSLVRLNSIFRKLGLDPDEPGSKTPDLALLQAEEKALIDELLLSAAQVPGQVLLALQQHELSQIAHAAYALAQQLNHYYHRYTVMNEADGALKQVRITILSVVRRSLVDLLGILGIPVPERM